MKSRKLALYIMIVAIIICSSLVGLRQPDTKPQYIRFHVIANSDSPFDQTLKLMIRDRLLESFGEQFGNISSVDAGREKIIDNLKTIEDIAKKEVSKAGSNYPVKAELGFYDFPTKAYGDLVLPAGNYEALRVVIGEGQGANWWCVMFPPLCFVDITHGVAKEQESERQEYSRSAEDYTKQTLKSSDIVMEKETIEYRLKILEWWQVLKIKVTDIWKGISPI